ncbi:MAG: amylo-alpha-1,6-glucosidase [bacterium]
MNKEFLLVNKLGGFASSQFNLVNTRKYHGLLIAGWDPEQRWNIVNRIDDSMEVAGKTTELSSNIYQGNVIYPQGEQLIKSSNQEIYPSWFYEVSGIQIQKSLVIDKNANRVYLKYTFHNFSGSVAKFRVTPLITCRSIHELKRFDKQKDLYPLYFSNNQVNLKLSAEQLLKIEYLPCEFQPAPDIYYNFYYPEEALRGYDALEDLQKIGDFTFQIPAGKSSFTLSFTAENIASKVAIPEQLADPFLTFSLSQQRLLAHFYSSNQISESQLTNLAVLRAAEFLVQFEQPAIIAGYHWFGEWGRDTFLGFKGILLIPQKFLEAKQLLIKWGKWIKDGLLPNRPFYQDYHSLDAIFWYAIAFWEYYQATGSLVDLEFCVTQLENAYLAITAGQANLTVAREGFLVDHLYTEARTWMDAKHQGLPVIDRSGQAVEIQALWYNFLKILEQFKLKINDRTHLQEIKKIQLNLKRNFSKQFWNEKQNCLFDVIRSDFQDNSIRPNQLFVLYLPFSDLVSVRAAKRILFTIEHKLLTKVGLRTLAKADPLYQASYSGDEIQRNLAYHNGTIWLFFLGIYLIAYLKVHNFSKQAQLMVTKRLDDLHKFIQSEKLQTFPEIFTETTWQSAGCISQAWSTALILEVIALVNYAGGYKL